MPTVVILTVRITVRVLVFLLVRENVRLNVHLTVMVVVKMVAKRPVSSDVRNHQCKVVEEVDRVVGLAVIGVIEVMFPVEGMQQVKVVAADV